VFAVGWALAEGPNEREAKPQVNVEDKDDFWVLDFKFKDPRLVSVNIPGRGKRVVWYVWYQVINHTKEPRTIYPSFELVTHDKNTVHRDQVLPRAQKAVQEIEDPLGHLSIKNSVTIADQPIPVSKPDAYPTAVTGVALWDDVSLDTTHFSIFVTGLSNGFTETDDKVIRRKTLQLNFKRLGEVQPGDSREIHFVGPPQWLYRVWSTAAAKPAEPAAKPGAAVEPLLKLAPDR
jgi:hypothetical protein